jgi:diguanylate cyclase (GGDEF)-like protein
LENFLNLANHSIYLSKGNLFEYYTEKGLILSRKLKKYKIENFYLYSGIRYFNDGYYDKAKKYLEESILIFLKKHNKEEQNKEYKSNLSYAYASLADIYSYTNNPILAAKNYNLSEKYFVYLSDLINLKFGRSTLYYYMNIYDIALEELLEIEEIVNKEIVDPIEKENNLSSVYQMVAILYSKLNNVDGELKYAYKGYEISKKTNNPFYIIDSLTSISFGLLIKKDFTKIKENIDKIEFIIETEDFDSSSVIYNYYIVKYKYLIGVKKPKEALIVIDSFLEYMNSKEPDSIVKIYNHLSKVYFDNKKYKEALFYQKSYNEYFINTKLGNQKNMSEIFFSAFKSRNLEEKTRVLSRNYKEANNILNVKVENKNNIKNNIILNVFIISFILLAIIVLFFLYRRNKNISLMDDLTNTYNRRYIMNYSSKILSRKRDLSLVLFDLDFFKKINDTYGHDTGDKVLKELSNVVKENLRNGDKLARIGGEEFLILFNLNQEKSERAAERVRLLIESYIFRTIECNIRVTASFGVSSTETTKNHNLKDIYDSADKLLYKAKESGRNKVCF